MRANHLSCLLLTMSIALECGCGSSSVAPNQISSSQSAYDSGLAAFKSGAYAQALPEFTRAIETPGLTPDMLVDSLLKRAHCYSEAGEFEKSMADIEQAERGAMEMDKVHLARSFAFKKKGDQAAAQREYKKARQIDPRAKAL